LGNNINSNNFLEVLIAGVKLTPRVKYVRKCEGKRRVKSVMWLFTLLPVVFSLLDQIRSAAVRFFFTVDLFKPLFWKQFHGPFSHVCVDSFKYRAPSGSKCAPTQLNREQDILTLVVIPLEAVLDMRTSVYCSVPWDRSLDCSGQHIEHWRKCESFNILTRHTTCTTFYIKWVHLVNKKLTLLLYWKKNMHNITSNINPTTSYMREKLIA